MILLRLAFRNLLRNWWRSLLTLLIVAVSLGVLIWTNAFIAGWNEEMIHGATAVSVGQIQVHTKSYVKNSDLNANFATGSFLLEGLRQLRNVRNCSPRVHFYGLIGNEKRSQVARMTGVNPRLETRVTVISDALTKGRWLRAKKESSSHSREVVLGQGLARQLEVEVGDKLPVFAEAADGSLGNELLTVVGIVHTGTKQIDRYTAYLTLDAAQFIAALPGKIHELAIRSSDLSIARETSNRIQTYLSKEASRATLVARPWQEIKPGLYRMARVNRVAGWIVYGIILVVAVLGIFNTQRMSALERRREFGILEALGVTPSQLFLTVMIETLQLMIVGILVGLLLGMGMSYYHTVAGLDLSPFMGAKAYSFMGITFSSTVYFTFDALDVIDPALFIFIVGFFSGLWPAVQSARVDPATEIAGRQ